MNRRSALLVLPLVMGASRALAHDTWVLPAAHAVPEGSTISLRATSGMGFPALEFAIDPARIETAKIRLAGRTLPLERLSKGKGALRLSATPRGHGIAAVWLETKVKSIDLKPDQVKEYLDEIGAPVSVLEEWKAAGAAGRPARWREAYVKHAKTFVAVGDADADGSWAEPAGMRLEIVPGSNPAKWSAGSKLSVRLLRDGRPLAGFPVGMVEAGEKTGVLQTTDAEGSVSFTPGKKGWILIRATDLHRSDTPDADWKSDFSTMTAWVE